MLLVGLLDCNIRICHSSRVVVHNVMRAVMLLSIDDGFLCGCCRLSRSTRSVGLFYVTARQKKIRNRASLLTGLTF